MPELAYLNGEIMPLDQARVPVEDRGYQFGDAAYEFVAAVNGRLFAVEAHLDRLERTLLALAFPPLDRNRIREAIFTLHQRAGIARAGIYIQISRGVAPRSHAFPEKTVPQVLMTVRPVPPTPPEHLTRGIAAITLADQRWGRCDIKTVQLLANVMSKQRALDSGAYDAIFIGPDGTVREGTSSNLFIRSGQRLHTHPLTTEILPGITRAVLLDICRREGIEVLERRFDRQEMLAADEVVLTGTVTEVLPVTRIDGHVIGVGRPGPMAARLRAWLEALAADPDGP
ncbi:aminotransferase class IV [Desulfatitalea alkaliphila]|uniref:Aminotransferase class IV n=1 Tax=Desulfatitalea alkaliphila TaxID=2929485 RepID=A0AA41R796_9BACT|nr:aminotransferase class IV [Desulfatitalea alkaliphila]MCJ8502956.1 aminotransferase class IV [Desulfatitalea alkaliphila]